MNLTKKILVIEDHEAVRMLLNGILSKEFEVVTKVNGLEGMAYLATGNFPDLILVDMNMPGMDGIEFIKNLKCSGFYSKIPIFIVSGNEQKELQKTCLELGVKQIFGKPFRPSELRKKIKEELKEITLA